MASFFYKKHPQSVVASTSKISCIFDSTSHTIGPWDSRFQHGGPPSALLVRAIEMTALERQVPNVARISVNFFKPVPVGKLRVETTPIRDGPKASHIQSSLFDESSGKEIMRMFAVCLRKESIAQVPPVPAEAVPDRPEFSQNRFHFPEYMFKQPECYGKAMEIRAVEGEHGKGPTTAWFRQKVVTVEGETPSGLERLLTVADSGGGMSFYVDFLSHTFINADLNVNVIRPPQSDWICMKARTILNPELGSGLATTQLFDDRGLVAISSQTLLLQERK